MNRRGFLRMLGTGAAVVAVVPSQVFPFRRIFDFGHGIDKKIITFQDLANQHFAAMKEYTDTLMHEIPEWLTVPPLVGERTATAAMMMSENRFHVSPHVPKGFAFRMHPMELFKKLEYTPLRVMRSSSSAEKQALDFLGIDAKIDLPDLG